MPLPVVQYLQARHLLSFNVAAGNLNSSGAIVFGSPVDLSRSGTGTFEEFLVNNRPVTELFRATDMLVGNYQIEFEDFSATATEKTPSNGMGNLTAATVAADYIRFDAVYRPSYVTTGGIRVVAVGIRAEQAPIRIGSGQNNQSLTIIPCGYPLFFGLASATPPI